MGDDTPRGGLKKKRPGFDVDLVRVGDHWRTLGLLVSPDDDPKHLIVDDIWEPSLVSEWNTAHPEAQIRAGDTITKVNGTDNSGEDMLAKFQASGKDSTLNIRIE